MLDHHIVSLTRKPLQTLARRLHALKISPDQVSITGFVIGLLVIPALVLEWYPAALLCIVLNRLADGLDGPLARMTRATDAGGFLDIVLDFIFYSAVVFGFVLANPATNGPAGAALLFSFTGTGASFLAFAIMAERRGIANLKLPSKGFYYMGGLTEGTETVLFFLLFCLFPQYFPILAWLFAGCCLLTTVMRLIYGYRSLSGTTLS